MYRAQQAINSAITDFAGRINRMANNGDFADWATDLDNWSVLSFPQTWSDTSLGYGGVGGQMITSAQTVIIHDHSCAFVYIGGGLAYYLPNPSQKFWVDVASQNVKGQADYKKDYTKDV